MPKGIVDTPAKEKKWEKAKEIAAEQGKSDRWPLVMHIFKQMGGLSKDDEDKNIKIERALAAQGRKTAIPQEAHEVLHSWWQQNKDRLLSPKQKETLSNIQGVKQKRSSLKLVKSEYLQEMYNAISALKNELIEDLNKAKKSNSDKFIPWERSANHSEEHSEILNDILKKTDHEPHEVEFIKSFLSDRGHTPKEIENMYSLIKKGYHPREAAHLVSTLKVGRGEQTDPEKSKESKIMPTPLSQAMLNDLRPIIAQFLRIKEKTTASEPEKNPILHANKDNKLRIEQANQHYREERQRFLNSKDYKDLSPIDKIKATANWEKEYRQKNPNYAKRTTEIADQARHQHEINTRRRNDFIQEARESLAAPSALPYYHGEQETSEEFEGPQLSQKEIIQSTEAPEDSSESITMSPQEAAQSIGQKSSDKEKQSVSFKTNPWMVFATQNPNYAEHTRITVQKQKKSMESSEPWDKPPDDPLSQIKEAFDRGEISREQVEKLVRRHLQEQKKSTETFAPEAGAEPETAPKMAEKPVFTDPVGKGSAKAPEPTKAPEPVKASEQTSSPEPVKGVQAIKNMAKPEQLERMQNVDAAKMAIKQKKE